VTRRIFFGSPSGSMMTAAMTGWRTRAAVRGETDLLGAASSPFRQNLVQGAGSAELLVGGLGASGGSSDRQPASCCAAGPGLWAAFGAAFGGALGHYGRGAGSRLLSLGAGSQQQADSAVATNRAVTRPRDQTGTARYKIHCGERAERKRQKPLQAPPSRWAAVSLPNEADTARPPQSCRLQYSGGRKDQCRRASWRPPEPGVTAMVKPPCTISDQLRAAPPGARARPWSALYALAGTLALATDQAAEPRHAIAMHGAPACRPTSPYALRQSRGKGAAGAGHSQHLRLNPLIVGASPCSRSEGLWSKA
jgi:hypothetical protein